MRIVFLSQLLLFEFIFTLNGKLFFVFFHNVLVGFMEIIITLNEFERISLIERLTHKEALNVVALHILQEVILTNSFDSLCNGLDAEAVNKVDYRVSDSLISLIIVDLVNE